MIDIKLVKIIRNDIEQRKFYRVLKKINKLSHKYPIFMGIDFEFNTKKIGLMQILFEVHFKNRIVKKYYIIYPPNMNKKYVDFLKVKILANLKILKILHGSESLDIPYIVHDLYDYFYEKDLENLLDFFLSMVDTRYLCEYLNLANNKPNICRLYDLLLNYNVITTKERKLLDNNEKKMGAIYNINININNLTTELINYSIHDVVYLVDLYNTLKINIIKSNPKDYYLLVDCLRYCFMERRYISNIGDDISLINMTNNYFYFLNKTDKKIIPLLTTIFDNLKQNKENEEVLNDDNYHKISLLQTYNIIINEFMASYDNAKYILNINYIKTNILNLLRFVVYHIIFKYYKVKSSNVETFEIDLTKKYNVILHDLKLLDLHFLLEFVNKFYNFTQKALLPS